ncbi:UNVERIFIED_CONTAM: hypothetical protein Slati_0180700 [Sesamum latifolium]|uniref:Retrovirus-related Pol polyprotein from transposon TNT 1-94-like beta-barrel domain-containing protein n=1 Tax=Sesamum latifolium TaxID=2727402 RepID=A0AAW2YB23_9LAMI
MATTVQLNDWSYDSGPTIHVCNDKNLSKDYEIALLKKVRTGNASTVTFLDKGSVEVHLTCENDWLSTNVLHVPQTRRIWCRMLFGEKKAVIEFDKLILTKCGVFVGKGYYYDGMSNFVLMQAL